MQRALNYAIVDEVDSILIDEARTPLIISGPAEESTELYVKINRWCRGSRVQKQEDGPGDYSVDEKSKQVHLSEEGHEQRRAAHVAKPGLLREGESLYDAANIRLMHHLNAALRAHALYQRDVEYIVRNGEVVIVDEFTGRTMPGRRWSDGLHQAVEAKEKVQGARGEPDGRLDHLPELLPHLLQARRHDRHRGHRGLRVPADLRPRSGRDPDAQADDPR